MNKKLRYMMLCLSLFAFGCNDWLDVQPKSQVKEEDLFSSESGIPRCIDGYLCLDGKGRNLRRQQYHGIYGYACADL